MSDQSRLQERVEVLKRIMLRVEFLGLSNSADVVQVENVDQCERYLISYALNIDISEVYSLYPQNLEPLQLTLKKVICHLHLDSVPNSSLYQTLLSDSIVPQSPFIQSYLSSHPKPLDSITDLFLSESLYKVHSLTKKLNLLENSNGLIRLTVTNEKGANSEDKIYSLHKNKEFRSRTNRDDNLLIFGLNSKNDKIIDVNFYDTADRGDESLIGVLALKSDGIYAVDLLNFDNLGIGLIGPAEMLKGMVFRLGNFAFLTVTGMRSTRVPFIKLKITAQENEYEFCDIGKEYFIGKSKTDINCLISGVSNTHCCIFYDKGICRWMIRDEGSTNGTYMLLKNSTEFENNLCSDVKNLGFSDFTLSLGSQRFLVQIPK